METHLKGIQGNNTDNLGNIAPVFMPMHLCKKIETAIEESDLVDETIVCQRFHLTKKSLANYRWAGKLRGCFTVAFNGARFYYMSKLLGLKNIVSRKKIA